MAPAAKMARGHFPVKRVTHQAAYALAQAIIELLDDPTRRQKMGTQGRERAVGNFAVDKVMAQTLELYERAMAT